MVSAPTHEITGLSYIVVSEISHLVTLQWLQRRFDWLKGSIIQLFLLL